MGGAGSAVNEILLKNNTNTKVINIGVPDKFYNHATREEQLETSDISKESIISKIKKCLENNDLYDPNQFSNINNT